MRRKYTNVGVKVGVDVGVRVTVAVGEGVALGGSHSAVCDWADWAVPAMTVSTSPGADVGKLDWDGNT